LYDETFTVDQEKIDKIKDDIKTIKSNDKEDNALNDLKDHWKEYLIYLAETYTKTAVENKNEYLEIIKDFISVIFDNNDAFIDKGESFVIKVKKDVSCTIKFKEPKLCKRNKKSEEE
jgi:hypothetical protein